MRAPVRSFLRLLKWIDGSPLFPRMEPYRLRLFEQAFDERDAAGVPVHNLVLSGRAKKNHKTTDLVLAAFVGLFDDCPNGSQVYVVANDEDQAGNDLDLAKKLVRVNPAIADRVKVKTNVIERRDGNGFIEILAAKDAVGAHGTTYRLLCIDEIHGYRDWDLLEALALDPTRRESQQWITSYATLFHKPGVPLFDLCKMAREGSDPRLLFSWYAGDFTTDPDFATATPEERANPSMASWGNPGYLAQQRRRLPHHKYRRLHLNLPGMPEGTAYVAEKVIDAVDRGIVERPVPAGATAFVDMSGGSSDDAALGIAHRDEDGRAILDVVINQGARPPFDPRLAVERFAGVLKAHRISSVTGDRYAGQTFVKDFEGHGIAYRVSDRTKSQIYEALEAPLNGGRVRLVDVPELEQQSLGLGWRGGRIDHAPGEHDDWANAACGALRLALEGEVVDDDTISAAMDIGAEAEDPLGLPTGFNL